MFEKYNHFTHWNSKKHFIHWNIPASKSSSTVTSATRRQIYIQSQQKKHLIKASNLSKVYNKYNKTTSFCCFNESFKVVCRTKSLSSAYLSVYLFVCLSVCLSVYLSVCLSVCLSTHHFSQNLFTRFFRYETISPIHETRDHTWKKNVLPNLLDKKQTKTEAFMFHKKLCHKCFLGMH